MNGLFTNIVQHGTESNNNNKTLCTLNAEREKDLIGAATALNGLSSKKDESLDDAGGTTLLLENTNEDGGGEPVARKPRPRKHPPPLQK